MQGLAPFHLNEKIGVLLPLERLVEHQQREARSTAKQRARRPPVVDDAGPRSR